MSTRSSLAGASDVSGATAPFMRGSIAAATSRPPQPQREKQRRNSSASLVTASNGPAPDRTWWTFTRGPSCESVPVWAVAGAGWPGRSEGVGPQAHDRARTPPGGDRRPIQAGAGARDGPLVGDGLQRRALVVGRRVAGDAGGGVGVDLVERLAREQRRGQRIEVVAVLGEQDRHV